MNDMHDASQEAKCKRKAPSISIKEEARRSKKKMLRVMASYRTKRVTDPLDDKAKARLIGNDVIHGPDYVSSGSEHSGDGHYSPCLSDLVCSFLESCGGIRDDSVTESDSECNGESESESATGTVLMNPRVEDEAVDQFREALSSHVSTAMEALSISGLVSNKPMIRRRVMVFLRNLGHNAVICKTKWPGGGNITGGSYEFIDVIVVDSSNPQSLHRYIIDLDFAGELEIARPTKRYSRLIQSLPRIYIGRSEDLKEVVKIVCHEAKTSMKSRELHLPPWRKNRYMQNKWFGPHRRTANSVAAETSQVTVHQPPYAAAKCRSVGFDVNGRFFVAATRTR